MYKAIDIGVEGLETGSRERIATIHFRVQTPCCARTAKFLLLCHQLTVFLVVLLAFTRANSAKE